MSSVIQALLGRSIASQPVNAPNTENNINIVASNVPSDATNIPLNVNWLESRLQLIESVVADIRARNPQAVPVSVGENMTTAEADEAVAATVRRF
jgi:hypothetical protein